MNKVLALGLTAGLAMLVSGCATYSDYVEPSDIQSGVKNPYNISASDFVKAADEAVVYLVASREWKEYLADYAVQAKYHFEKKNPGQPMPVRLTRPTLILNTLVNNTANEFSDGERFDPKFLTERIRSCLASPNQLSETLLAMSYYNRIAYDRLMRMTGGAYTVPETSQVRVRTDLAGNGHTVDTAVQAGGYDSVFGELAPANTDAAYFDLSLNGSISRMDASAGNRSEISYLFALTLSDRKTGEAVWTWSTEIRRQHRRGIFGP